MTRLAILALRLPIVLLVLGCLGVEAFIIPLLAAEAAREMPELSPLAVPYAILGILTVLCVQVALLSVWGLLSMVADNAIFAGRAVGRVNVIIGCGVVATLLTLVVAVHLFGVVQSGGPPIVALMLGGCVVAGGAFVLLMIVMRALLRVATAMRSELDEVV